MLSIGSKLGMSFAALGAICVVTGIVSYQQTQVVRQRMEDVVKVREPVNAAVHSLQHILTESAFATLRYLSTGDSASLPTLDDNLERFTQFQDMIREADAQATDAGVGGRIEAEFAGVQVMAENLISFQDVQRETLQSLLRDFETIDALLTERIQASVSVTDPVAFRRLQAVLEMKAHINAITRGLGTFLVTGEPHFESRFRQAEQQFKHFLQVYHSVLLSSEEKQWAAELRQRSTGALTQTQSVFALDKERRARLSEFLTACRQLGALLDDRVLQRTERSLSDGQAELLRAGEQAKASILVSLAASLAFGLGAGYVTRRNVTLPLRKLSSVMLAIARGEDAERPDGATTVEMRALGEAFGLMTGKLLKANADLQEAQSERLAALRRFTRSVQRAQEDERARISRELHDDLCQRLSGMKFRAEALEDDLPPASKRAQHRIQELTQELDRTITEVRRISSNLRPSALDDFGLVAALRMLCKGYEGLHDLRTEFHHQGVPGDRVDPSVEIALYRIAQEALSNVSKHAGASTVTLRLVQEEKSLRLIISDNGKGFDPVTVERSRFTGRSFGLISMRERTELLGGSFLTESVAGQGTTVTATLPLGGLADDEEDQDPDRG